MFSNEELLKSNRHIENLQYLNPWENISQNVCCDFVDPCDNGNHPEEEMNNKCGQGCQGRGTRSNASFLSFYGKLQ